MMNLVMDLLSGLALFLFGMKYMSDSLQQAAGQKLRGILNRCTTNKYKAVVFGALFTAFIQSSGATTVMEVGFVNAGIMTLGQSVGITFGANIGTTITSQLVSLKLTACLLYTSTRDIPEGVFAAGNPCRVIRKITEKDSIKYRKDLF